MAMLIGKFHRLIQSRLLWGVFLVIIIFTFVIWGMQMPDESRKASEANAAGKLDGKVVTQQEFRQAYFNVYMSLLLSLGRPISINERIDAELRTSAWERLVALREAKKLGIEASNPEVMAAIQNNPGFVVEGRFSRPHYNGFIQNILAPLGFTDVQFEEHVREEIVLQKMRYLVAQNVMVSPVELKRTFDILTDHFTVDYVSLSVSNVEADVKVTEEDARAYFLANQKAFEIPEQAKVKYIQFPVSDYRSEEEVTEEEALEYYNEHLDDYMTGTGEKAEEAEAEEKAEETALEEEAASTNDIAIPFETVKTNILEVIAEDRARSKAAEAATDFVVLLAPDRSGQAPAFDDAATEHKKTILNAGPFGLGDEVEGIEDSDAFTTAAFRLNPNPEEYFSDAIAASNTVYVLALVEKIAPRIPAYEEVAQLAMDLARETALNEALAKKAQDLREAVLKGIEAGGDFKSAVKPFKLVPQRMNDFSVSTGLEETNDYSAVIIRGVISHNQGEVTELLTAPDAVLLAYVAKRTPGDQSMFPEMRAQLSESMKRQRSQALFEEWKKHLLVAGKFEDRQAAPVAEETEEESGDETPQDDTSAYQ